MILFILKWTSFFTVPFLLRSAWKYTFEVFAIYKVKIYEIMCFFASDNFLQEMHTWYFWFENKVLTFAAWYVWEQSSDDLEYDCSKITFKKDADVLPVVFCFTKKNKNKRLWESSCVSSCQRNIWCEGKKWKVNDAYPCFVHMKSKKDKISWKKKKQRALILVSKK